MVWIVLIIGAVVLGLVVSAAGTETRLQIEYLTEIQDHAVQMSRNGDTLDRIANRLSTISRDEFVTATNSIIGDIETALAFVEDDPPVLSVIPVRSLFRQALGSWHAGMEGFAASILDASDNPLDATVVDRIAQALADLRAGDALYLRLLGELDRDDLPDPLSPLPPVVVAPGDGGLLALANSYAVDARMDTNTLTLRPGLRVSSVISDPDWQLDTNESAVVIATETIRFSVVISNTGNVESGIQHLALVLAGQAGQESQLLEVPALRPGLAVTIEFEPFEVSPGQTYVVTATLQGVTEDLDFTDNAISVEFTVNTD